MGKRVFRAEGQQGLKTKVIGQENGIFMNIDDVNVLRLGEVMERETRS